MILGFLSAAWLAAGLGASDQASEGLNARSIRVLRTFAECVVATKPERAADLIRSLPESQEQAVAARAIIGRESRCIAIDRMALSATLFRGAIAEALMAAPHVSWRTVGATPHPDTFDTFYARLQAADVDGLDEKEIALVTARWFARCVAREQPVFVRSLLRTEPFSERESALLGEAGVAFSSCLPQGRTLTVNRLTMRGLLAEALYLRLNGLAAHEAPASFAYSGVPEPAAMGDGVETPNRRALQSRTNRGTNSTDA